ncbi:MAG: anti-sigma factor [Thermodesulfobacteriota bacterium]
MNNTMNMISCEGLVKFTIDYLDGDLAPEEEKEFDLHIDGCIDCHAFLNTYRKTVSLLSNLSCKEIPEDLRTKISDFLRERG